MRVYRYEDEKGQGPYSKSEFEGGEAKHIIPVDPVRHPGPSSDPNFDRTPKYGGKYAFVSPKQMNAWFNPREQETLQKAGFHPTVYEVPDRNVKWGARQAKIMPKHEGPGRWGEYPMRKMPTPKITVE